jgi:hypothetical protein
LNGRCWATHRDTTTRTEQALGKSCIKKALKARKELVDFLWFSQIGDGISDGVLLAELQQWRELFQGQLPHTQRHVVLETGRPDPDRVDGASAAPQSGWRSG